MQGEQEADEGGPKEGGIGTFSKKAVSGEECGCSLLGPNVVTGAIYGACRAFAESHIRLSTLCVGVVFACEPFLAFGNFVGAKFLIASSVIVIPITLSVMSGKYDKDLNTIKSISFLMSSIFYSFFFFLLSVDFLSALSVVFPVWLFRHPMIAAVIYSSVITSCAFVPVVQKIRKVHFNKKTPRRVYILLFVFQVILTLLASYGMSQFYVTGAVKYAFFSHWWGWFLWSYIVGCRFFWRSRLGGGCDVKGEQNA